MTYGEKSLNKPNISIGSLVKFYAHEIDFVKAWKLDNNDNQNSTFDVNLDNNELGMVLDVKFYHQIWYIRTLINGRTGWIESKYLTKACL